MKQMLNVTRFIFRGFFLILVVLIYVHVPGGLQAMPPHNVPCWDAESKFRINGMIDEEAWQKALKLELNYEVTPGENIKPPVRTEVFLAYSKTHFYVGFHAYDPEPSAIQARLTDRDNIFDDDWVCISVDTFSDHRRIYSFYCNPLGIQASGPLKVWLNGAVGHQVDYTNIRSGTRFMLNPGINYKAGRHFSINLDHVFERFNVETGRLYTANVSNLRLVYQFSRRAFLRTIFQYVNYQYNIENYTIPIESEFKHFFSQVLFSYKVNPQTMLFLGYSDDSYGNEDIPLTQANRTFFLKIGYALVL